MQLLTLKGDVSSTNVIMEHVHCNSHSGEAINSNNGAYLRPHMGKQTSLVYLQNVLLSKETLDSWHVFCFQLPFCHSLGT